MTTLAALLPGLKAVRVFTASGTWTKPADLRFALVEVIGGGGGGAASAGTGTTGGTSSFSTVSATGGLGGNYSASSSTFVRGGVGGAGAGGDINYNGSQGGASRFVSAADHQDGWGAASRYMPYGRGGHGNTVTGTAARGGGGSGGYARKIFDATALPASVAVTIGAAGSGLAGITGAGSGLVVVYEYA